jgi:hypothetical protein
MKSFLSRTSRIACAALVASACWPTAPALAQARQTIVPCNTAALITAINNANTAGQGVLLLAPACTYTLNAAASMGTRGPNGLPIINSNLTILGRGATIRRAAGAPEFRIMEIAQGRTVILNLLTISGGDAGPNPGGGILNARGLLTLQNVTITNNTADSGAGLANDTGQVTMSSGSVTNNDTGNGGGGGGIYNDGMLNMTAVAVRNNRANTSGGGIYNELGGVATLVATIIQGNEAEQRGGGLYNGPGGVARLTGTTVIQNTAGDTGGGIYNATFTGAVTLTASAVVANTPNNCAPPGTVPGCTN